MRKLQPLPALFATLRLLLQGRVHFPRERVGQEIEIDGETWRIFRAVVVDPAPGQPPTPGAIFRPRFHVRGMPARLNILFSWIPVWFILGLPGFRSKLWLVQPQTGDFSGCYEWDTITDAENYGKSFAAGFMTRRSVPGSVSFHVQPNTGQAAMGKVADRA